MPARSGIEREWGWCPNSALIILAIANLNTRKRNSMGARYWLRPPLQSPGHWHNTEHIELLEVILEADIFPHANASFMLGTASGFRIEREDGALTLVETAGI